MMLGVALHPSEITTPVVVLSCMYEKKGNLPSSSFIPLLLFCRAVSTHGVLCGSRDGRHYLSLYPLLLLQYYTMIVFI